MSKKTRPKAAASKTPRGRQRGSAKQATLSPNALDMLTPSKN
jgi:hypothetical protein